MLAGCSTAYQGGPAGSPQSVAGGAPVPPGTPQTVAILLPLTGPRADLAQPMLQAAQLALSAPGAPRLVQQDTAGTPAGATHAMQTAMAAGARLILGPLTAPEVLAVAPIARQAQIPVLAFSNDTAVAQPGVWPLGITPGEQVRRLVGAGRAAGKTQFAAFLPDSDFGHALGNALSQAVTAAGLAPPNVQFHGPGMNAINQGMQSLSDYESRSGGQHVGEVSTTAVPPPPPFDALLLGDVGEPLAELASILQVRISLDRPPCRSWGRANGPIRPAGRASCAARGSPRRIPRRGSLSCRRSWRATAVRPGRCRTWRMMRRRSLGSPRLPGLRLPR